MHFPYRQAALIIFALAFFHAGVFAAADGAGGLRKITVEYYFQPGCAECELIDNNVLPALEERFSGLYDLKKYDIGVKDNFIRLATRQDKFGITSNEPVSMAVDGRFFLNGYKNIESQLPSKIDEALSLPPLAEEVAPVKPDANAVLESRSEKITLAAVLAAGLIDGINPCVFSTLVFFLSLLAVSGVTGRKLLLVGSVYCLACFLSYLALGFGLFRFIKLFSEYRMLQSVFGGAMIIALVVLAFLSFRDAWLYGKTGSPGSVTLQLPDSLKKIIRGMMRKGLHYRYLVPGAFLVGVAVTAVESVCTGQVYVPALALLTQKSLASKWLLYLLLYNVMFIIPLLALFALAFTGMNSAKFLELSRRNVVPAKIAMGLFFIAMALLIMLL